MGILIMRIKRSSFIALSMISLLSSVPASLAQSAPAGDSGNHSSTPSPINLDLSSTERTLSAAHLIGTSPVEILVAGQSISVTGSSTLTPAERLAVYQVVSTGAQSIQIGAGGNAIGGSFNVGPRFSNYVSSLTVPQGVTALFDSAHSPAMNLTGNLTNAGAIYAGSSNAQFNSASIAALNIINQPGGVISSILPVDILSSLGGALSNINLNLSAVQSIINAGTISSSGNLTAIAGTSILNSSVSAQTPIMQAFGSLNLQAPSIINQGTLVSQNGNLNIATASLTNSGIIQSMMGNAAIQNLLSNQLSISNQLGSITANGTMELSTLGTTYDTANSPLSKAIMTVLGGTFSASTIAMNSPGGDINIDVDSISGGLGIKGYNSNIKVQGGDLNIVSLDLGGDPSFVNVTGDVNLGPGPAPIGTASFNIFSGGPVFKTAGGPFTVLAGGNIVALNGAAGTVDASLQGGIGGAITLTAGTAGNGGSVILPSINFLTNGNSIEITAKASATNPGTVSVGTLNSSGAGADCCYNMGGVKAPSGQGAGNITISAPGGISTGALRAFGGGGAGGYASDAPGGDGGKGGSVSLTTLGNIVVGGEINTSGGGGGGLSASTTPSTFGGAGGAAGNITISTSGKVVTFGPILAAGGGGGAGNTKAPCCPQIYRNGGGSFGGGGGGGDVGAGGGGYFGGGGSLSFGSGGGGGFFGGGQGANGQQDGSLGRGGDSSELPVLYHFGGLFGEGGGPTNTYVAQKGFGNAGGAGGANGSIQVSGQSLDILATVGGYFGTPAFTNSQFADTTVFGNYSGLTVTTPAGSAPPTNTVTNAPPPPVVNPQTPTIDPQILNLFLTGQISSLTQLDGSQSGSARNYDTANVADYGWFLNSTGQTILVNAPNNNNSLYAVLAIQPTGVSSVGNSLSSAGNSIDTSASMANVSDARRNGQDYRVPGYEAKGGAFTFDPLVGSPTGYLSQAGLNQLLNQIQHMNDQAARQAAAEGRYSWTGMGSYNGTGSNGGFIGLASYIQSNGFVPLGSYNDSGNYTEYNQYNTGNSFTEWQERNRPINLNGNSMLAMMILDSYGVKGGEIRTLGEEAPPGVEMTNGQVTKFTVRTANGVVVSYTRNEDGWMATRPDGNPMPVQFNVTPPDERGNIVILTQSGPMIRDPNGNLKPLGGAGGPSQPGNSSRPPAPTTQTPPQPSNNNGLPPGIFILPGQNQPVRQGPNGTFIPVTLTPDGRWVDRPQNNYQLPSPNGIIETIGNMIDLPLIAMTSSSELPLNQATVPQTKFEGASQWRKNEVMRILLSAHQARAARDRKSDLRKTQAAKTRNGATGELSKQAQSTHKNESARHAESNSTAPIILQNGNTVFAPVNTIKLVAGEEVLTIKPGAKVLVLKTDRELGVYNLHDRNSDDVTVSCKGKIVSVPPGQFIVHSEKPVLEFDEINPGKPIPYRDVERRECGGAVFFCGEFSIPGAITSVSMLKDFIKSTDPYKQKFASDIKKMAAIRSQLRKGSGPFKTSPQPLAMTDSSHNINRIETASSR